MQVTVDLPDEPSATLFGYLPCAVLESVALEQYRERKLTTAEVHRLLDFQTRYELDGFPKQREVWLDYTWHDLERITRPASGFSPDMMYEGHL